MPPEKFTCGVYLAAAGLALAAAGPAAAEPVAPLTADIQGITFAAGGAADGTALSILPGGRVSGDASAWLALSRDYDTGLSLALEGSFQLYADRLSGDNYGNDLVQKVYGRMQTGLGRLEIGMNDGAAYALAETGPTVDEQTSLDNANITFFRSSVIRAGKESFALNSAVESSLNYAKFSYYTPILFGVQIGVSYTPAQGKYVLPFVDSGDKTTNRQDNIWETAIRYDGDQGPFEIALALSGAVAHAKDGKGLTDWAAGGTIAYPLDDDTKIALGGAYRHSNANAFDINENFIGAATCSAHLSAKLERGSWSAGLEYGDGTADGSPASVMYLPRLREHGYGAAVGYAFDDNWSATLGWQNLRYHRNDSDYGNGTRRLDLNAIYLHLRFRVAED